MLDYLGINRSEVDLIIRFVVKSKVKRGEALMKKLKVLFVAAEADGLIKVGGLGDVAGELPSKLAGLGADVWLIMPAYQGIDAPARYITDFPVRMGSREETCVIKETSNSSIKTLLVENSRYFGRPSVYGYDDDPERFAFFCLAVFTLLKSLDFKPDVIHLNDWHTAPLAMLIRENSDQNPLYSSYAIVFTIHSLVYQGVCGRDVFKLYGVGDAVYKPERVEYFGAFNPMKAGIYYADRITTVSETGARDMMSKEFGFGLEGFIANRKDSICGVVNGIDFLKWDPASDAALFRQYSAENPELKRENKVKLQKELGLIATEAPLFGVVSRLAEVKGIDLLIPAIKQIVKDGGQIVVLGKGDLYYEQALKFLQEDYPENVAVRLAFDDRLARRIYAASDMFLMPSRYEPCGLSQLIAMRYGAVPVVHKVGGLADTVLDETAHEGAGTGFSFETYSPQGLIRAIKKCIRLYKTDKEKWEGLVKRAMAHDSSWEKSAGIYMSIYREAVKIRRQESGAGSQNS